MSSKAAARLTTASDRLQMGRKVFTDANKAKSETDEDQAKALQAVEALQKSSGGPAKPVKNGSVDISNLQDNPYQYLQRDADEENEDDAEYLALYHSIKDYGYLGGIIVSKLGDTYYIVQGHRRARIIRRLVREEDFNPTITVTSVELTEDQMIGFLISSNSSSRPISPTKTALAVKFYQDQKKLVIRDIARVMGLGTKTIEHYVVVNKMPLNVQKALEQGTVSLNQVIQMHNENLYGTKKVTEGPATKQTQAESSEDEDVDDSGIAAVPSKKQPQTDFEKQVKKLQGNASQTKTLQKIEQYMAKTLAELEELESLAPVWEEKLLKLVEQTKLKIATLAEQDT
jgi:hypothetical protein